MYRRPTSLVLPELVSLGMFITSESRLGGERRDGTTGLEIGFLEHGIVEWWNGEELEEAEPPSVLIDPPGDWQGGASAIVHPCTRYWLRFEFPDQGELPGVSRSTTLALRHSFDSIDRHFFPGDPSLAKLFVQLLDQQRQPGIFAEELSRALFHQILVMVLRNFEMVANEVSSPQIAAAKAYLADNYRMKVHIQDVAALAGYSVGHFHEVFLREVGLSPLQFQLKQRISQAKRALISTDSHITDIALDLGFSSSQYFSTAFRKVVGLTPAAYRQIRTTRRA
ncbi:hypothetical protein VE25_13445 [Devosia geojensis]|uniref:HTH araC/xylS-type domain-containing protein n=2 Tax=Devosia geojensis TaxID=443610 RepID=A0A0F5FR04_9HYPH|nr:hypothetical protein VE25_13445 [Devosia geojensis]